MSLQDYQTVTDKQLMQYLPTLKWKLEDAPRLLKIPESECPDVWLRLPHTWPKSGATIVDPVVLLERNSCGHPVAGWVWERQFEEVVIENSELGCMSVHRKQGLFLSVNVDETQNGWKEAECKSMNIVDLGFLDHVNLGCTQRVNASRTRVLLSNIEKSIKYNEFWF